MSESHGFDPLVSGGWLVDESLFRSLTDFEIKKAQRLRYSLALVCLALEPISHGNGKASPSSLAETVRRYVRSTDAVAAWAQGWLSLLLIDAETTHLPLIVERLTGRLDAVWSAGGSCYPRTATRTDDMVRQAVSLLDQAQREGGNRLYVAS